MRTRPNSGQGPDEIFGDPRHYATVLAAELSPEPAPPTYNWRGVVMLLPTILGLTVGMMWVFADSANTTAVSVGQILLVTIAVPAWVVFTTPLARPRPRDPLAPHRRAFDEHGWRGLWVTMGLVILGAGLWTGLDHTVFHISTWILAVVALVLFTTGMLLFWLLAPQTKDRRRENCATM